MRHSRKEQASSVGVSSKKKTQGRLCPKCGYVGNLVIVTVARKEE